MGEVQKLKGKEKFAYGIGAVGKDMVYMLSASYVLYYYQDIMGQCCGNGGDPVYRPNF